MSITRPPPSPPSPPSPPPADDVDRRCEQCGYDLRGLDEPRCPECGLRFDPTRAERPDVPWLRACDDEMFIAYWQTVWLAWTRPHVLSNQIWRRVWIDEKRCRWFGWLSMVAGAGSLAVVEAAAVAPWSPPIFIVLLAIWATVGNVVGFAFALGVVATLDRGRRAARESDRFARLARFTLAPLNALLVAAALTLCAVAIDDPGGRQAARVMWGLALCLVPAVLAHWGFVVVAYSARASDLGRLDVLLDVMAVAGGLVMAAFIGLGVTLVGVFISFVCIAIAF